MTDEKTSSVLLIHGEKDGNIPVRHSRRIARRNATVVFWDVPGADHCGAISASPGQFTAKVLNWFAGHQLAAEASGKVQCYTRRRVRTLTAQARTSSRPLRGV